MKDREFWLRAYTITLLFISFIVVCGILHQDGTIAVAIFTALGTLLGYGYGRKRAKKIS